MNRMRLVMLALMTVLALSAVAASAASAFTEFTAGGGEFTAAEGAKLKSKQKGNQTLEAKAGKVTVATICTEVSGEGTIEAEKMSIKGTPTYKGCTVAGLGATVANTCTFTFDDSAVVDLGGKGCATIEVTSTKCKMTIEGEQPGLKTLTYKNEGANLVTEGKVTGVNFKSANGKACGFETEAVTGTATYTGASLTEGTNIGPQLNLKAKGNQTLEATVGKVTITMICTEMSGTGAAWAKKTRLLFNPKYGNCTVEGQPATVTNSCWFTYNINETFNLDKVSNCATIFVPATGCIITMTGEQAGLKEVKYTNEKANLVIEGKVSGLKFTSAEGKACKFEPGAVKGEAKYTGSQLVEGVNVK